MENRQDDGFGLPPRFIQQIKKIIKNRMGIRRTEWIELNLETRIILIKEAKYLFNSEMILKFGSKYNYQRIGQKGGDLHPTMIIKNLKFERTALKIVLIIIPGLLKVMDSRIIMTTSYLD